MIGSRLHRGATLALLVAAIATTLAYWHGHLPETRTACGPPPVADVTLAELLWYGLGALLALFVLRVVTTHRTRAQAWALGLGLGGMVFAQVADRPELTFPFIRWDMFARAPQPLAKVSGYRLEAIAPDGSRRRLSMIDLYSLAGWRVDTELGSLARRIDQDRACKRDRDADAGERELDTLVQRIARRVPDARTIDVVRITWPGDGDGLAREDRAVRRSVAVGGAP